MRLRLTLLVILIAAAGFWYFFDSKYFNASENAVDTVKNSLQNRDIQTIITKPEPLSIDALRAHKLDDSELQIVETLSSALNYERFIASYVSEGNTIYGLLTIPSSQAPQNGFPIIIFNHGYIPPLEYRTTERYVAYQDAFASNGYITFKSDYRGHGDSEGDASGGYGSNAYTIDVLNALEAVKKVEQADPSRVGMWGHSMGGFITLRSMVVRNDIDAGVIWGGVVASYPDLINNWRRQSVTPRPLPSGARRWRQLLIEKYGEPSDESEFWRSLSANSYLHEISGPVQLHHGTSDESVPYQFSENLESQLKEQKKRVDLYLYDGDDHDVTNNFNTAIQRSVQFFEAHVKNK